MRASGSTIFARGAVLIAHNAPFDMEFLRRHEKDIGAQFDNPVLDTVLLSAVVYGQLEQHSLDALTARLGITIPEEARHTAIGDTVATADAFFETAANVAGQGVGNLWRCVGRSAAARAAVEGS